MILRPGIVLIMLMGGFLASCGEAFQDAPSEGIERIETIQPTLRPQPTPEETDQPKPAAASFSAFPRLEFGDGEEEIELDLKQYIRAEEVDELRFGWEIQGDSQLQIEIQKGVLRASLPDLTWHGLEVILLEACDSTGDCAVAEIEASKAKEDFPPRILGFGEQVIFGGESFQVIDLDRHVIDLDHEPGELTWSAISSEKFRAEVDSQNLMISALDPGWRGSETLVVEVCDPDGLCDKSEVELSVIDRADVKLTYVVNEGFIIESGGKKVILDGLLSTVGNFEVPVSVQGAMTTGQAPFDDVDLVLTTHNHDDHFDPLIVGAFLRANPQARFVSTSQTISNLVVNFADFEEIDEQVIEVYPAAGKKEHLFVNGIEVEVFNLPHGRYQNLGLMFNLGGVRFLHTGDYFEEDANSAIQLLQNYGFPQEGIDVAFVADPFLRYDRYDQVVPEGIRPGLLVPMHYVGSQPGSLFEILAERYPDSILFTRELESLELTFPR